MSQIIPMKEEILNQPKETSTDQQQPQNEEKQKSKFELEEEIASKMLLSLKNSQELFDIKGKTFKKKKLISFRKKKKI